jgi:hypothetical protein
MSSRPSLLEDCTHVRWGVLCLLSSRTHGFCNISVHPNPSVGTRGDRGAQGKSGCHTFEVRINVLLPNRPCARSQLLDRAKRLLDGVMHRRLSILMSCSICRKVTGSCSLIPESCTVKCPSAITSLEAAIWQIELVFRVYRYGCRGELLLLAMICLCCTIGFAAQTAQTAQPGHPFIRSENPGRGRIAHGERS